MSNIVDVTLNDFEQQVLEASREVPVVVDFWASWCGPCRALMPILTGLAEAYQGKFKLAKVNIDEQPELATHFGVRSVPTVKILKAGQVVDEFLGAIPEGQIRAILDRHIERESDEMLAQAVALLQQGELEPARALMARAAELDPENYRMQLQRAELLLQLGDYEEVQSILKTLPAGVQAEDAVGVLSARLEFASVAREAPDVAALEKRVENDASDSEARYQLAAHRVLRGEYEAAMEQLLAILRRDRTFGDDAGRKGLVKVFNILGGQGELVNRYRGLMSAALY